MSDDIERLYDIAYPELLRQKEHWLRFKKHPDDIKAPPLKVGVAVSGGGIRSATFALGFFQAICRAKLLAGIDCISTVSGGGYFGGFLGRLFHRPYVRTVDDVEAVLTGPHPSSPKNPRTADEAGWKVLGWLRENGRYLSPRGAGDLLLGGAILLRNWVSIHVVLAVFVLLVFLLFQIPRLESVQTAVSSNAVAASLIAHERTALQRLPLPGYLWWSPWVIPPLWLLAFAVPPGWAYWLVPRSQKVSAHDTLFGYSHAWIAIALSMLGGIAAVVVVRAADGPLGEGVMKLCRVAIVLGGVATLAAAWYLLIKLSASVGRAAHLTFSQAQLFRDSSVRNRLSTWVLRLLIAAAALAAVGLIDTLGQSVYHALKEDEFKRWGAGIAAAFAGLAGIGRQLVVLSGAKPGGARPRLPLSIIAAAVAFVLFVILLTGVNVLAHAIAWQFGPTAHHFASDADDSAITVTAPANVSVHVLSEPAASPSNLKETRTPGRSSATLFFMWLGGVGLLAWAFGRTFPFLNQSSHQMLYAARLTRAYLGASNPARWHSSLAVMRPVIDPVPGDDIELHEYWQPPGPGAPSSRSLTDTSPCDCPEDVYGKGMPLHIVNVTVNETYDGQSQVQQQDRKGIGMALGPTGMSVGIRHHVVVRHDQRPAHSGRKRHVSVERIFPASGFRVFDYEEGGVDLPPDKIGPEFPWDPLSFGRWIGISGAAFSTGVGSRTSLGLSLLTGFANVRLGYWWDSGVNPEDREQQPPSRLGNQLHRAFTWCFPVQSYLLSEFVARFPGTSQRRWYLSDGGHFENLGGYELIRRGVPLIVVVDAEADPEYNFEGLANLVRKARLDFQTEITFLDEEGLKSFGLGAPTWGPLAQLRPDRRGLETAATAKKNDNGVAQSPARFALARVRYSFDPDDKASGLLVYVKPTLVGNEPADVWEYARANRPFPQQTTIDQFFDEAQWESYRRLGEFIGTQLVGAMHGNDAFRVLRRNRSRDENA